MKNYSSLTETGVPPRRGVSRTSFTDRRSYAGKLTGAKTIDRVLTDLCPNVINANAMEIEKLSELIDAYLFNKARIAQEIEAMTSAEAVEYLDEISTFIATNGVRTVHDFEALLDTQKRESLERLRRST